MNPLGIHYAVFVRDYDEDQLALISKAKELGFDLLEIGVPRLLELDDEALAAYREEAGRQEVILAASLGLSTAQDIGSPDSSIREAGRRALSDTAAAMAKAGISECSGIVYGGWNAKISDYSEKALYWKNSVATMKEVMKVFVDNGVYLSIEAVNRFENFLINTCREACAYLEEVDSPNLGIHLDTFHMNIEEDSMVAAIGEAGDRLRFVHLGENNRKFPGLGTMPWKIIFDALAGIGYTGPISMEPFVRPGGEVGSSVSLYREMMDTGDYEGDIRRSQEFVRGMVSQNQVRK